MTDGVAAALDALRDAARYSGGLKAGSGAHMTAILSLIPHVDMLAREVRRLTAEVETARAVLESAEVYGVWPDLNSLHGFLKVDSAAWRAWRAR